MDFAALNYFDYTVLGVIFCSVLFAFLRGFIQTIFSFLGWMCAGFATFYALPMVKPLLYSKVKENMHFVVDIVSPVLLYFVFLILFSIINYQIFFLTRAIRGNIIDRSLGFMVGLLRGIVITCVIYLGIVSATPFWKGKTEGAADLPSWLKGAQSYNFLKVTSAYLMENLPASLQHRIELSLKSLNPDTKTVSASLASFASSAPTIDALIKALPKDKAGGIDVNMLQKLITDSTAATPASGDLVSPASINGLGALLNAYREGVQNGSIPREMQIPEGQLQSLEKALTPPASEGQKPAENGQAPGYDKQQLKEIDRLINTIH